MKFLKYSLLLSLILVPLFLICSKKQVATDFCFQDFSSESSEDIFLKAKKDGFFPVHRKTEKKNESRLVVAVSEGPFFRFACEFVFDDKGIKDRRVIADD